MKSLATLIAILFFVSVFGQSTQLIDSVEHTLNTYGPDDKAFALYTLVSYYQRSNRRKTLQFRQQALALLNDPHPKAQNLCPDRRRYLLHRCGFTRQRRILVCQRPGVSGNNQ